jgi:hypothetical protein
MTEYERFRQEVRASKMDELQQNRLLRYFKPSYRAELEFLLPGELVPRVFVWRFAEKDRAEALRFFDEKEECKRIVEESVLSGRENVIAEREETRPWDPTRESEEADY